MSKPFKPVCFRCDRPLTIRWRNNREEKKTYAKIKPCADCVKAAIKKVTNSKKTKVIAIIDKVGREAPDSYQEVMLLYSNMRDAIIEELS